MEGLSLNTVEEIDYEVAKRDFKFFFEDILGFQLSHHHEGGAGPRQINPVLMLSFMESSVQSKM